MTLYDFERRGPGDLIATEPDGWTFTRVSAPLDNDDAAELNIQNPIGYPVGASAGGGYRILLATEESECIGFVVEGQPIEALAQNGTTASKYAILVRGAATVRPSGIAADDPAGDAYDKAALLTAVAALSPPILPVDETPEVSFDPLAS